MKDFSWECRTKVRFGQCCVREYLADLVKEFALPATLRELGFGEEEHALLPEIAESCFIAEGAFRQLTNEEILEIYEECW